MTTVIVFLISLLAFLLSAISGGGAGLILMPVLGSLLPATQIPAALSIGTFTGAASRLIVFFKSIRFSIVIYFMPPAIVAVVAGANLLKFINPLYLQVIMGLFLIAQLPAVFKKQPETEFRPISNWHMVGVGFLAGFLSGLTGAVGLLFNKFYLRQGLKKEQIMATRAANEILLHLIKFIVYSALGLITKDVLLIGFVVSAAAIISTFLSKYLLAFISLKFFQTIGYMAMVMSGVFILAQSGKQLFKDNRGQISYLPVAKGIETRIQWQNTDISLEFTYDEGLEFEVLIPFNQLPNDMQNRINAQKEGASRVVIEKVYSLEGSAYEAYYFNQSTLLKKLDFE